MVQMHDCHLRFHMESAAYFAGVKVYPLELLVMSVVLHYASDTDETGNSYVIDADPGINLL